MFKSALFWSHLLESMVQPMMGHPSRIPIQADITRLLPPSTPPTPLIAELEKRSSKSNVTGKISVNYSVLPSSTETSQQGSAQDSFLDIFESIIR